MSNVWAHACVLGLLATLSAGCAVIEAKAPSVAETPLRSERAEVISTGVKATVEQRGDDFTVVASHACDVWERPTVLRTTTRRFENRSAMTDAVLASAAAVMLGVGVLLLVDAGNIPEEAPNSSSYNPVGRGPAIGLGVLSAIGGLALGTIPLVDVIRARSVEVHDQPVKLTGQRVAEDIVCTAAPADAAPVQLGFDRIAYALGVTDPRGTFRGKTNDIGPEVVLPVDDAKGAVFVAGARVGTVDLRAVAAARVDAAWRKVNLQQCVEAPTPEACGSVERHLRDYPGGPHVADARRVLDRVEPQLAKGREGAAWRKVAPSVSACSGRDFVEPDAIEVACAILARYSRDFPNGERAREAESVAAAGRTRAQGLRAGADRKREEEERRLSAQKAESEKRETASSRQKCVNTCRAQCTAAGASTFVDCFQGCVEASCGK